ncbi:hypothetical protein [Sphingomonas yabuuchiae]
MTDRPIIFSAPMVRALLTGRKTQTRRLASSPLARCAVGDRLYVREAWAPLSACTHNDPGSQAMADNGFYRADGGTIEGQISRWTPSIHQPRWASRLTLTVVDARIQPLCSITDADAQAEGVQQIAGGWHVPEADLPQMPTAAGAFARLWSSLHRTDGECWCDNPDVVALTFTVTAENIDRMAASAANPQESARG